MEYAIVSGLMIDATRDYKPGDLPPEGYMEWTAWAEVQRKAGIKQVSCPLCGLWKTPQELSKEINTMIGKRFNKKSGMIETVEVEALICTTCADKIKG